VLCNYFEFGSRPFRVPFDSIDAATASAIRAFGEHELTHGARGILTKDLLGLAHNAVTLMTRCSRPPTVLQKRGLLREYETIVTMASLHRRATGAPNETWGRNPTTTARALYKALEPPRGGRISGTHALINRAYCILAEGLNGHAVPPDANPGRKKAEIWALINDRLNPGGPLFDLFRELKAKLDSDAK
jgi:hypothetical protein